MIITETRVINGSAFDYTYSDKGMMIERDGMWYSEAYDPQGSGRVYTETDIPVETESDPRNIEAQYAQAGRILMGVNR